MRLKDIRRCMTAVAIGLWFILGPGARPAQGYIDPGTGASLFSSLGLLLGVACAGIAIGFTQFKRGLAWLIAIVTARRGTRRSKAQSPER